MSEKEKHIASFSAVVMGASAGGFEAMTEIFSILPSGFRLPILIVQHLHNTDNGRFAEHLSRISSLPVIEPCDKELVKEGCIYTAPANYHMSVERNFSISLSVDEKVNWSRPSIDVLFESAARAWGRRLIAVILSGANFDGSKGMLTIKEFGGFLIAQDPETAEQSAMPKSAIKLAGTETVLSPSEIGKYLMVLSSSNYTSTKWSKPGRAGDIQ